jgi:prepilin-type N-terminal cleavage/methylation domain-containing protein
MNKKPNSGFTVIELLVTLAIIGVLLIVTVGVGRSAIQRASFTNVLNQFVADVSYARQLASRLNRYVAIDFDDAGRYYVIKVQDKIGNYTDFSDNKTVDPLSGREFFANATDFAVNSMGIVRGFPVVANSPPITVTIDFLQKNRSSGDVDYKKKVTVFSSGGIKIEE